MCTLFLKLAQCYNTQYSKNEFFFWTGLKQADKDHYSDWSEHTEIEPKAPKMYV